MKKIETTQKTLVFNVGDKVKAKNGRVGVIVAIEGEIIYVAKPGSHKRHCFNRADLTK